MRRFPEPIQKLMYAFGQLPGVGPKTALRYVYAVLSMGKDEAGLLAKHILDAIEHLRLCPSCFTYTESDGPCDVCSDPQRDRTRLCVVEWARDISTIEATNAYRGLYFVLGGTLDPLEGITPDVLKIRELLKRASGSPFQ